MSLMSTFGVITQNFKFKPQEYIIDNWIFRLHYKLTVLIFLVSTIMVTSRQYIGDHISCIADSGVPTHVMNTFCFFTTTFTVPHPNTTLDKLDEKVKHMDAKLLDAGNLAHPGVGPYGMNSTETIVRHAYYQWVPFVLFGQAIMFYLTHLLWKHLEGGRLKYLVDGLKLGAYALEETEMVVNGKKIPSRLQRVESIQKLRDAFLQRIYINNLWSTKLAFCEVLNLLHIILEVYVTNMFLGGSFNSLGSEIWTEGLDSNVDILDEVFPKITKCTFHKYGPSGSIQLHDAMCVMALNIINEKIYSCLWFWFVFLFICTALGLVWRILTVILHAKSRRFNRLVFANTCPGRLNPWKTTGVTVSQRFNFTDWLFLKYISKNLDGVVFKELFMSVVEELDDMKPPREALLQPSEF